MKSYQILTQVLVAVVLFSGGAQADGGSLLSKIKDKVKAAQDKFAEDYKSYGSQSEYLKKVIATYTDEDGRVLTVRNQDVSKAKCSDTYHEKRVLKENLASSFYMDCTLTNEQTGRSIYYHTALIGPQYNVARGSETNLSPSFDVTSIFEPFQRADGHDTYYTFTPWDAGPSPSLCKDLNIHKMTKRVDPTNPKNVALTQAPLHSYIRMCDEEFFNRDQIVTKKVTLDFQDDQSSKHSVYSLLNSPPIIEQMKQFVANPLRFDQEAKNAYVAKGATQEAAEAWELNRNGLTHLENFSVSYQCRTIPLKFFLIK